MKQEVIKIKVLEGAMELVGKKLSLIKVGEMQYRCISSKIEIFDDWEELDLIEEYSKRSEDNILYDMHLFSTSFDDELKYIDEVKFLGTKTKEINMKSVLVANRKNDSDRFVNDGISPFSESSIDDEIPNLKIKPSSSYTPF